MVERKVCHLVVIEDNAADIFLIEEAIRSHQIDCRNIVFESYEEAMHAIASGQLAEVDGMLIDLNLRTGSGLEILNALRASETLRRIPVAILTSSDSPRDREAALRLGADLYIRKPTGLDEFLGDVGGAVLQLLGLAKQSARNSPR